MRIKEAEQVSGITAKNIRFYEKEGLLMPDRRPNSRYRDSEEEDISRLSDNEYA